MEKAIIFDYSFKKKLRQHASPLVFSIIVVGLLARQELGHHTSARGTLAFLLMLALGPANLVISMRNSAIKVDSAGVSARFLFFTWKRRPWNTITQIQKVDVVRGPGGKDAFETRFIILGPKRDKFYPLNFDQTISGVEELLAMLNEYSAKYGIELYYQRILYRMAPDTEADTILDALTTSFSRR